MKALFPLALALAVAGPSFAQNDEIRDAATTYVGTPTTQNMFDDMFSVEGILEQMEIDVDSLDAEQKDQIASMVVEAMKANRPSMEQALISGMAEVLSLTEIRTLTDFQSTDYGATTLARMDPYFKSTMQNFAPSAQSMQEHLFARIREIIGR
ncbi:MAG: hypothetical protein ABJ327_04110 [Litoreibacter sp.]